MRVRQMVIHIEPTKVERKEALRNAERRVFKKFALSRRLRGRRRSMGRKWT